MSRMARASLIGSRSAASSSGEMETRLTPVNRSREIGSGEKNAQMCRIWWAAGLRVLSSSNDTFHAAATETS